MFKTKRRVEYKLEELVIIILEKPRHNHHQVHQAYLKPFLAKIIDETKSHILVDSWTINLFCGVVNEHEIIRHPSKVELEYYLGL